MAKPVKFSRSSVLRQTEDQYLAIHAERKTEDVVPSYSEMVRMLIDEGLRARRHAREPGQRPLRADEMVLVGRGA